MLRNVVKIVNYNGTEGEHMWGGEYAIVCQNLSKHFSMPMIIGSN